MVVYDLACALAEKNHKVVVFTTKGSQSIPNGFVYEVVEPKGTVQCDWLKAEREMWVGYKDKLKDFDIIHSHDWFGFAYASKSQNPKLKVCHTHHGHINMQWWGRSQPPFKLNFIAISKWMKQVYGNQGIASEYVYNGINTSKYPYKAKKGDRLLFVGRFDKFKQPHVAIEVAKKLDMGLDLIGGTFVQDINYLNKIRELASADDRINMYEDVDHATKVKFYQNAKCTLFISCMSEPFGLIAPESFCCGTPVVGTNDGAIPETVKEGGIICLNNVDSIVEGVKQAVKISPKKCRQNGLRFSREVMSENYIKLYRKILAGKEW